MYFSFLFFLLILSIPGPNRITGGGGEVDKTRSAVGGGSGLSGSWRAASVTNKVMEEEEEPKEAVGPVIRSWLEGMWRTLGGRMARNHRQMANDDWARVAHYTTDYCTRSHLSEN